MKIFKSLLACLMCFTLVACGQKKAKSSEEVGEILEKEGYEVNRVDGLTRDTSPGGRSIFLIQEDNDTQIFANFDKKKKLESVVYNVDDKMYTIEGEKTTKEADELKEEYDEWLEKLDITHEEFINYLKEVNKTVRDSGEIYEIIEDCDFEGEVDSVTGVWDHVLTLESDDGYFFGACYKDKKLGRVVFSNTSDADGLFVWENGKVVDDSGYRGYSLFLFVYNITHEEMLGYLESLYEINFEE